MSLAALQTGAVHAATAVLAQPEGADPGGRGEGFGKSTPVGLFLMILLLVVVGLLVRSMTKHLKRVPASFDPDAQDAEHDEVSERSADGAGTEPDEQGGPSDEQHAVSERSDSG